MPELPEVEVVKLFLEDKLLGQKIIKLDILNPKSFIGDPQQVIGQTITSFSRIGKQLSIHLSNKLILLVHLKMTGQLILQPPLLAKPKSPDVGWSRGGPGGGGVMLGHPYLPAVASAQAGLIHKSTRLVFLFSNKIKLFFNDQRKFGWVKIFNSKALKHYQSNLGHDIFDPLFTSDYLYSQLQKSRRSVKVVLLDQHFFAGIGNIYANDALFLSHIHPSTPANNIQSTQAPQLYSSIVSIMQQSILAGGSTMKDNKYIRPDGSSGSNQFLFRVYGRAGENCLNCQSKIKKINLSGRGTFFCPSCQPN